MTKRRWIRSAGAGACVCVLSALLAACAGGAGGTGGSIGLPSGGTGATSPASSGATINLQGVVHGGQSPIVGATVTLYEAGPAGEAATVLGTATTAADGSYSFSSVTSYGNNGACATASSLVYVVASGGNPGAGVNNAINLMAAIGPCGSIPSYVVINELTTVAAVYALNGFAYQSSVPTGTPGTLNGCVDCALATTSDMTELNGNAPGITNAFNNAALLADVATGNPAAWLPTAGQCGGSSPPANCGAVEKLSSLATALAACVNTESDSSSQCVELFDCAVPGASFTSGTGDAPGTCTPPDGSTPATDTLTATLYIARDPGLVAINGVFDVSTLYVQFSPVLTAAPNDWTLALNFTGGGLNSPTGIAIDSSGDVWVANGNNSVTELTPSGTAISPTSGFTGGGLNSPYGIAIDSSGDVWVANNGGSSVTEIGNPGGGAISPASGFTGGGLNFPYGIAIDASGDVWVANAGNSSVTELGNPGGGAISPASGFTGGGLNVPYGIAIDPSGDVWVANAYGDSVTEVIGAAVPTITPLVAQIEPPSLNLVHPITITPHL